MNIFNPLHFIEFVTAKFGIGSALSIGASLIGGLSGSKAAKGAAGQANAGLEMAAEELRKSNTQIRKDTAPYRDLGAGATNKLSYLLGIGSKTDKYTMGDFAKYNESYAPSWYQAKPPQETDTNKQYDSYLEALRSGRPANVGGDNLYQNADLSNYGFRTLNDYTGQEYGSLLDSFSQKDLDRDVVYNTGLQFGLDQGNKQLNNRATAMGAYDSGATLKALTQWANDYGNTKAGEAQQRFMNDKAFTYNTLSGSAGIGQNAVNTAAQSAMSIGQALAQGQAAQGTNKAAGTIGSANSWSSALGGVAKTVGSLFV